MKWGTFEPAKSFILRPFPRAEFCVITPGGKFVRFTGVPKPGRIDANGEMPVAIEDIEILECGNIYDREGSD